MPGDGDVIGRLNQGMYGFRDASNGWQKDWQELLRSDGYDIGVANPALFKCDSQKSKGAVHGDDFYVLANRRTLDHMAELLKSKYNVRESHRLGFGFHCVQQAHVLNRVVTLGVDENTGKRSARGAYHSFIGSGRSSYQKLERARSQGDRPGVPFEGAVAEAIT